MNRTATLFAALAALAGSAPAQQPVRVTLIDTAVLAAPRLTESSGVVASRRAPGLYWTHNDSGDEAVLYATDSTGSDLGFVRVAGARNLDWEDLAYGPCVRAPEGCLYAADIGDNHRRRARIVLYRLEEPAPPRGPGDTLRTAPLLDSIVLRYPDRAHDAEALAVTPDGTLLLVAKDLVGPAVLFRAPAPGDGPQGPITLQRAGELSLTTDLARGRVVTGAALSPDGRNLVLRTYVSLHFFRLGADSLPAPLTPPNGITIPIVESQGEGVAFDGPDRLVLTSERGPGDHAILTRLRILGLDR